MRKTLDMLGDDTGTMVASDNNGGGFEPPIQVAPFHQEVALYQQHQPVDLRIYHCCMTPAILLRPVS